MTILVIPSLFQWNAETRSPKQLRAGHVSDIVVMPHYPSAKQGGEKMVDQLKVKLLLFRKNMEKTLEEIFRTKKNSPYRLFQSNKITKEQSGIAIVTMVKDESPYIREWLEFYFMIGVSHIFVYDNDSTDDTHSVLKPYIDVGLVTVMPWRNFSNTLNPQVLAYMHALTNFCLNFRWVALIDLDEFIFPAKGSSLEKTLSELTHLPVINLPWINFGPSGHKKKPEGLVIESYTERAAFPPRPEQYSLLRYKSIVNPRKVDHVALHWCSLIDEGPIMINDREVRFAPYQARNAQFASAEKLRLHHYFTRSYEEIDRKIAKGRATKRGLVVKTALNRRLRQYELFIESDTTIERFIPELKKRLTNSNITSSKIPEHI